MIAPLAADGLWGAVRAAGCLLDESGRVDVAIAMYQPALDASNLSAVDFVARMLARHGRGDEVQHLADVLARHNRHDELRALIDGYGKEYAAHRFALHLESVGQVEGAITLLAPMAADESRNPSSFLAGILVRAERDISLSGPQK